MRTLPSRLARRLGRTSLPLVALGLLACKGAASTPPKPETPPAAGLAATYSASAPDAGARAAVEDAAVARDVADIVARYRKNVVLGSGAEGLDEASRERIGIVGRMIFEQNHQQLARLGERLAEALTTGAGAPTAPAPVLAFLDTLERDTELHDADKLAFKDLVEDLAATVGELPPGAAWKAPLLTRLQEDQKALKEIQGLYEKELEKIFGQFETRGMTVRREAWEAYVVFVKTRFSRERILQDFEQELKPLEEGTRGGAAPAPRKEEGILTGTSLPPKTLVLTFDDGPHHRRTAAILATLEQYKAKALFFQVASNVATAGKDGALKTSGAAAQSRKLLEAGHVLANHTLSHVFLPKLGEEQLARELDESKRILETTTGSQVTLFRPPYGAHSEKVRAALAARGMKPYLWNIDSLDWSDPIPTSVAHRVVQEVEKYGRGVILMHDIHSQTVEALPKVLETLQARGYRFVLWDGTTIQGDGAPQAAPTAEAPGPHLYGNSWAVVIGINEYQKWPRLSYAVNDAQGVRDMLVDKFHFKPENVQVLLNQEATRERILSVLGDSLSDPTKVKREDRVFVFFAGHGVTRKLPNGRSLGYIVPVDADTANYQSTAISMTNFQDISESIAAKHVFYVMDACYSGLALTRGAGAAPAGDVRKYLQEVTRRSTRQVLTAGGADEQVADQGPQGHSIFTWTLLQGLQGQADLNADGFITASELASYVGPTVSSMSRQTPAFGSLVGSEGGEFVLELNHDGEFLSETSSQLDAQAIQLNAELEKVRKEIEAKTKRNQELAQQLATAKGQLAQLEAGAAPATGGNVVLASGTLTASRGASPTSPETAKQARQHNDRGMDLYREKRHADALAEFLAAATLAPTDAQVANNVGFVHYKLGQYAEARKWLEKTLALDGGRAVAWLNMGDTYDKLGRREDAARAWRRYLELMPNGPAASSVKAKLGH